MATFRSRHMPRNSSSEDSDSSDDEKPWKRRCDAIIKNPDAEFINPLTGQKTSAKKFSVWSNVLTDQTVTGELCNFDLVEEKKSDTVVARDVESYRVTSEAVKKLYPNAKMSAYNDLDAQDEDDMDADEKSGNEDDTDDFMKMLTSYKKAKDEWEKKPKDLREKIKNKKRKNDIRDKSKADHLSHTRANAVYTSESQFQFDVPLANPTDTKDVVLKCILDTLQEKNDELFQTILDNIGHEKALELLNKTEDIESAGGMMIKSGIRRRSPGGVYIQLLRSDEVATPELIKLLFPPQVRDKEDKNRRKKEARRRKRTALAKVRDVETENLMDVKTEPFNFSTDTKMESAGMAVDNPQEQTVEMQADAEDGEIVSD